MLSLFFKCIGIIFLIGVFFTPESRLLGGVYVWLILCVYAIFTEGFSILDHLTKR